MVKLIFLIGSIYGMDKLGASPGLGLKLLGNSEAVYGRAGLALIDAFVGAIKHRVFLSLTASSEPGNTTAAEIAVIPFFCSAALQATRQGLDRPKRGGTLAVERTAFLARTCIAAIGLLDAANLVAQRDALVALPR
ncbi:hypothetical protein [Bradyrhizobium sp. STM 3562]|uniref:hypothetical protein n=1 Tax=Bradyrhizobium sp. STM 3562 TaxID=578924 RepID=UPI00388DC47D